MNDVKQFDVELVYRDEKNDECSVTLLAQGMGVIGQLDCNTEEFFWSDGRMKWYVNRIYCMLDHDRTGDLITYVMMMMRCLCRLYGIEKNKVFRTLCLKQRRLGFDNVLSWCHGIDDSEVVVQDADSNVAVSFVDPAGETPDDRLSPYFLQVLLPKLLWREACFAALSEFWRVAATRTSDTSNWRVLPEWQSMWRAIESAAAQQRDP